jgi:hypothetical protein
VWHGPIRPTRSATRAVFCSGTVRFPSRRHACMHADAGQHLFIDICNFWAVVLGRHFCMVSVSFEVKYTSPVCPSLQLAWMRGTSLARRGRSPSPPSRSCVLRARRKMMCIYENTTKTTAGNIHTHNLAIPAKQNKQKTVR